MNISVEWLIEKNACVKAIAAFKNQRESDSLKILRLLIEKNLDWASWLIVRVMDYREYLQYAIFASESVLDKFEKIYPQDTRPRCAIEVAKECLKNKETAENAKGAESKAWRAGKDAWGTKNTESATSAIWAAESAAWTAKSAILAAENPVRSAVNAVESACWTVGITGPNATWTTENYARMMDITEASAYWAAASAAKSVGWVARDAMQLKILKYGVTLLERR